jgi:hypothetical protein
MTKRREIADRRSGKAKGPEKSGLEQKTDAVALREEAQRRKQLEIVNLFGTIEFDPKYDYKSERRRKRTGK